MYFREKTSSNGTRLLQLVRGSRCLDGKVRQQVLLSLGGCAIPDVLRREIARNVEAIVSGQQMLMPPTKPEAAFWSDLIIDRMKSEGKLDLVRNSVTRNVPPGAVADGVLLDAVSHGGHQADWRPAADQAGVGKPWPVRISRHGKAFRPGASRRPGMRLQPSRRAMRRERNPSWQETVAMDELLDEKLGLFGKEIFCRAGDDLLGHGRRNRQALAGRGRKTCSALGNAIFLYDLTNSCFEGRCAENPKARRSASSKEKRTDCPLLALGLVINAEGFPIVHKVFPGNTSDSKTIPDIVSSLRREAATQGVRPWCWMAALPPRPTSRSAGKQLRLHSERQADRAPNFAEDFKRREAFRAVGGATTGSRSS
jgi:hypothetical protein